MRLARIFGDYMVLQRQRPILIRGSSGSEADIDVKLNGKLLCSRKIPAGEFSFLLPPQEAMEDAVLDIGPVRLSHVDIGEVWVAGGQSNMEFMLQYTSGSETEIAAANDGHLRCYTVGQYSFAGEREEGYKAWNPWDRWLPYTSGHAAEMTAVGVHFARELRRSGIPVGIVSCNWGGTSAAAWTDRAYLLAHPELKGYVEDFDALAAQTIPQVYMASSSDLGNIYDIHPKEKKPLGYRLALLAQKYVYGQDVSADAPQADGLTRVGEDAVSIHFRHGEGLHVHPADFSAYNGFPAEELPAELLPPVLDGINGLRVLADGAALENARCAVQNGRLLIRGEALKTAEHVRVEFANTGFYQVNLYNAAGLPAEPFILNI